MIRKQILSKMSNLFNAKPNYRRSNTRKGLKSGGFRVESLEQRKLMAADLFPAEEIESHHQQDAHEEEGGCEKDGKGKGERSHEEEIGGQEKSGHQKEGRDQEEDRS